MQHRAPLRGSVSRFLGSGGTYAATIFAYNGQLIGFGGIFASWRMKSKLEMA
jgi:hypothetical protein